MNIKGVVLFAILTLVHKGKCDNSKALENILASCEKFGNEFYGVMVKENPNDNVVFSPIGMHMILSLIYAGAQGKAAVLLADKLHLPNNIPLLREGFNEYLNLIYNNPSLVSQGRIFLSKDIILEKTFEKIALETFRTACQKVDFNNETETTWNIDYWLYKEMQGDFFEFSDRKRVLGDQTLVFAQGTMFRGEWLHKFDPEEQPMTFYRRENRETKVPMLYVDNFFKLVEDRHIGAHILELPFDLPDHPVSFFAVVPLERFGLQSVTEKLLNQDLSKLLDLSAVEPRPIVLNIPKFKLLLSRGILRAMVELGLADILHSPEAYAAMTKSAVVKTFIDQHVVFDLSANGTVASAGQVFLALRSGPAAPTTSEKFLIDHPFMFFIRSQHTGSIIYMGQLIDPLDG